MSARDVIIAIIARDMASGAINNVKGSLGGLGGAIKGIGSTIAAVGGAAMVMAGINGIGDLAKSAFDATASTERLSASLTTMLAKEQMSASVKKEVVRVGSQTIGVSAKQEAATTALASKVELLNAQIAVQQQKLNDATAKGKESSAELNLRRVRIQQMNDELEKTKEAITNAPAPQIVGVFKTITTQTMTLAEAQKIAAEKSKELVAWTKQVGLQSPFSKDDIASGLKLAMTYGLSSEEAKRLTMASVNLATATGGTGDVVERAGRAFGQITAKGKLMGGELLQLTEAGVPFRDILIESGVIAGLTTENFDKMMEKGMIPAKKALEAYTGYVEKNFGTAAKDQSLTLSGLANSWGDLKQQVLETALGPFFKAIQPYLASFIDMLQSPQVQAQLQQLGATVGEVTTKIIGGIAQAAPVISGLFSMLSGQGGGGGLAAMFPPETVAIINQVIGSLQVVGAVLEASFTPAFNTAKVVIENVFNAVYSIVSGVLSNVQTFIATHGEEIKFFFIGTWGKIGSIVNDALKLIDATVGEVLRRVGAFINTHGEAIQAAFNFAWETIKLTIGTVLDAIGAVIRVALQLFNGDAEGALETLKGFFETTWHNILAFLNNVLPDVTKFGEKFINNLVDSFKKNAGVVFETLKKIIMDAVGGVAKFLGISDGGAPAPNQGNKNGAGINMVGNAARFGGGGSRQPAFASAGGGVTRHQIVLGEKQVGEFLVDWYTQTIYQEGLRNG